MTGTGVQADPRTVRQLLTEDHYRVPAYQRNFAWGEEEIRQLIDDLLDAAADEATGEYFLGNVVVSAAPGSVDRPFSVVDGQQRLTTLHLLFRYLESHSGLVLHPLEFESRPRAARSFEFLGQTVTDVMDPGIAAGFRVISQYPKTAELSAHLDYVLEKVLVVRLQLPEGTDLNRYFEVMNTRGEQLQQQDIVKARLMARLPDDERSTFAWVWDACTLMDSYVQMALTPGNVRLRDRLFGPDWAWLQVDSLPELLEVHRDLTGSSPSFVAWGGSLAQAIGAYATTSVKDDGDSDEAERFSSVIEFPTFLLHVLRIVEGGQPREDEAQLDDKKLVRRFDEWLGAATDPADRVREFALTLLRCRVIFDAFIIKREFTSRTGDDGIWSLKRLVRGVSNDKAAPRYVGTFPLDRTPPGDTESTDDADGSKRVRLLESALRVTFTSPRTMHWMTTLLRVAFDTPANLSAEGLLGVLQVFARGKVADAFDSNGTFARSGFGIPRIVFTYIDYLLAERSGHLDFQFTFRNSVEHFYPQLPDEEIRDTYGPLVDPSDGDLLGNLALLTVRDNSRFSNLPPAEKARVQRIVDSSPKLGLMAKDARRWGTEQIRSHHEDMVRLLRQELADQGPDSRAEQILFEPQVENGDHAAATQEPQIDPHGIATEDVPRTVPEWVFGVFNAVVEEQTKLAGTKPGNTAANRSQRWRKLPLHGGAFYLVLDRSAFVEGRPFLEAHIYESDVPSFAGLEYQLHSAGFRDASAIGRSGGIRISLPISHDLTGDAMHAQLTSLVHQLRTAIERAGGA